MRTGMACLVSIMTTVGPASQPASADQCHEDVQAGIVVGFTGPSHSVELIRAGQRVSIGFFSELRGGDRFRLVELGRLSIQRADGGVQNASSVDIWFCVREAPRLTWWRNAQRIMGDSLTAARDDTEDLLTRGDGQLALAPPGLEDRSAIVGAGHRHLALAWQGGIPPFSVEILRADRTAVVSEANINARLLRLREPRSLPPDRYSVRVHDATGASVEGGFTALNTAPEPSSPEAAMGAAGELFAVGPTRAFDAFLVLSPFRQRSNVAKRLMDLVIARQ